MPKTEEEKHAKHEAETPLTKCSLPQLMGRLIARALEDPRTINQCGQDLAMWHDANLELDPEKRPDQIKEHRKIIERAKQATEYLYTQYLMIVQRDMP